MADYQFRDSDGSIRLDEALGERYVRHYLRILESSSEEFAAMQLTMGELPGDDDAPAVPRRSGNAGVTEDGWTVTRAGHGTVAASSCQEVEPSPSYCWDVCGYYRRLRVHWRASRREIMRAYNAVDPAGEQEPLHYALTQLLDPLVRRAYDRMPLGGLFMGDRDVLNRIERLSAREAARQTMRAREAGHEPVSQKDVLRQWGYERAPRAEAQQRLSGGGESLGSSLGQWERRWDWYAMTGGWDDPEPPGPEMLERWQALVAGALERAGLRSAFAVGTWPGSGPRSWRIGKEGCIIFFIGDDGQPTRRMADEAVRRAMRPSGY